MSSMKNRIDYTKRFALYAMLMTFTLTLSTCDDEDGVQTVINFTNLVWSDEFNTDGAPDPASWTYDIGDGSDTEAGAGWGNNEFQYYTDRPENVIVEDGMLKITAIQEDFSGSQYTSARVLTENLRQWTYGRFEARMKLPFGKGMWPAFWMLGTNSNTWPQRGEIDIMENRGDEPTIVHGSVHGPGYSGGDAITKSYDLIDERLDTEFHVYGIEWGPNYINYYIDDVLYNQITPDDLDDEDDVWVFNDNPFFIIFNLAVGGSFAGGAPGPETIFPQTLYVDYVRVYSAN